MKMMNFMMFFMAWMFYWVASGLCIYFIISAALGHPGAEAAAEAHAGQDEDRSLGRPRRRGPRARQALGQRQPQ